VGHVKVASISSTVATRWGRDRAIFIKTAPLAWTQTLGTQKECNKWYANGKRMRQLCKIRSEYEQTERVWTIFKRAKLHNTTQRSGH